MIETPPEALKQVEALVAVAGSEAGARVYAWVTVELARHRTRRERGQPHGPTCWAELAEHPDVQLPRSTLVERLRRAEPRTTAAAAYVYGVGPAALLEDRR